MKVIVFLLCLVVAVPAFAAVHNGYPIPVISPNANYTKILTINSTIIDMTRYTQWELYSPTACKVRHLPTNTKGGYSALTIPVTTRVSRGVNAGAYFTNFTGCTNGELIAE